MLTYVVFEEKNSRQVPRTRNHIVKVLIVFLETHKINHMKVRGKKVNFRVGYKLFLKRIAVYVGVTVTIEQNKHDWLVFGAYSKTS